MDSKTVNLKDFDRVFNADMRALKKKIEKAIVKAARKSRQGIIKRTPKAFGELRDSTHVVPGPQIRVDAPHAQAIELGMRPGHLVPIEALVKWVKLRGMQGLRRMPRAPQRVQSYSDKHGPTTRDMARRVASELKTMERNGSLSVDAPREIAYAIQQKIFRIGTRPHRYVEGSLHPVVLVDLDAEIRKALGK